MEKNNKREIKKVIKINNYKFFYDPNFIKSLDQMKFKNEKILSKK